MIITDEMVEAACKAEWDSVAREAKAASPDSPLQVVGWEDMFEETRRLWRISARAGLEAALGAVILGDRQAPQSALVVKLDHGGVDVGGRRYPMTPGDSLVLPLELRVT